MIQTRSPGSEPLVFGLLQCVGCGERQIFVGPPGTAHITDAFCSECGYVYGRVEVVEVVGEPGHQHHRYVTRPVISDAVARDAARALLVARGLRGIAPEEPPPFLAEPPERRGDDIDRRLRSLRSGRPIDP